MSGICSYCGEDCGHEPDCPITAMDDMKEDIGRLEAMSEWQPIDTAPKGGKWVLLWWPAVTDAPFVGYLVGGVWHAATHGDRWSGLPGPTHWMPLPEPPKESLLTEAETTT